jgi:hypothetical protein
MEQQKKNQNQTPSLSANKAGSTVNEKKSVLELLEEDDEFEVISPTVFFPSGFVLSLYRWFQSL